MKPVVSKTAPSTGSPQVHHNRKLFDDAIYGHGTPAWIERALECPCKAKGIGSALSTCQNCGGTGWFFIDKVETSVLSTSLSNRTKYEVWSKENMGTVSFAVRAGDKLGFMDRVTLLNYCSWFSQVVYPVIHNDENFAFLVYEPLDVYDAFVFTGDTTKHVLLRKDVDFRLERNKFILIGGYSATPDLQITIRYEHNAVYHVIDINRDHMKQKATDDGTVKNFPLNAIARRAHYILDAANQLGASLLDNTPVRPPVNYDR